MIVEKRIQEFEQFGFGLFVHFGIYSVLGKGEWSKFYVDISWEEYLKTQDDFDPKPDWAEELVINAKNAGCRYITLTTRHHDGFSLYDTCGLNTYDAPHVCGRDLVREFVDACNRNGIIPFFYHTLLDWREESYQTDFKEYLVYLRKSIELLCKNYGKIGGLWFDGMWDKPEEDWEEDALYGLIRSYQPDAMIINNTGLHCRGELGHIQLDSVTFERGRPEPINMEGAPKYVASEMCETVCDHWGYAQNDFNYKPTAELINTFAICRRYGSNLLLNVGPKGDGSLRAMDKAILEVLGQWHELNCEALHKARPCPIEIQGKPHNFMLQDNDNYYLFITDVPGRQTDHVVVGGESKDPMNTFAFDKAIKSAHWLDTGASVRYTQAEGLVTVEVEPRKYSESFVIRVAKLTV